MQYSLQNTPVSLEEAHTRAGLPYFPVTIEWLRTHPYTCEVTDKKGDRHTYTLPGNASLDARLLTLWLNGKSAKTIRAYMQDVDHFYTHLLTRATHTLQEEGLQIVCAAQVRVDEVQSFKNGLTRYKDSSQARMVAAVKSLLTYGADSRILSFNVGRVVKLPSIEGRRAERITTETNIALLFKYAKKHPRNHALIVLLYRTGMRVAEICDMQWRHLQPREGTANGVRYAGQVSIYGKGNKNRTVLLTQDTWTLIMELKAQDSLPTEYVFQSQKEHEKTVKHGEETVIAKTRRLDESTVLRILKSIAVEADVETYRQADGTVTSRISPHWLRHAHATHARKHGAPLTIVRDTLGHSNIATTALYDEIAPDESSATYLEI